MTLTIIFTMAELGLITVAWHLQSLPLAMVAFLLMLIWGLIECVNPPYPATLRLKHGLVVTEDDIHARLLEDAGILPPKEGK